jgi:hypothetical protein
MPPLRQDRDAKTGRLAWAVAAFFAVAQVGLAWVSWGEARRGSVTYVFTPMLDVEPAGAPLSAEEAARLQKDLPNGLVRSDVSGAFSLLGSTLSLDDLLRGVETLELAGKPLDAAQSARIGAILESAKDDHAAILQVQSDVLDTEAEIRREIEEIAAMLPPEAAARISRGSKAPGRPPGPPR